MNSNHNTPIISVIMSIYSEPIEWIKQSIDSILNQSFDNFEFIIINDNPTRSENSNLLDAYAAIDNRIVIINNPTNLGLPVSLNKGLELAKGKYIARMDADDISLPERFLTQYNFLENNPDYGICGTYARFIYEDSKVGRKLRLSKNNDDLKARQLFYTPFVHPSIMARKDLITKLKYDENFRVAQDVELWLRMSDYTKFYNIPQVLLHYRIHKQNSRVREKRNIQDKILKEMHLKRFNYFIPNCSIVKMKELYINFCVRPADVSISKRDIDTLFQYLLEQLGNDKIMYKVLFKRYIYELFKDKSFVKIFYNPFINYSSIKYFKNWIIYLKDFYV